MANYLFSGGTVIDCTGAKPKKAAVFIEGNRIAKIGEEAAVKKFAEGKKYKTIDASGKTVMPGMIDCHVHPSYGDILSIEELDLYSTVEYRTLKSAHFIKKVLRAGITAMGCPGGTWNINVALRDAVASGLIEGPRISAGGHYLSTYNSTGSFFPSHIEHPKSSFAVMCNTKEEFVKQARLEIKNGVDIVKVSGDGDTGTTAGMALAGSITLEELKAIAEIVHLMDKKCTIHARSGRVSADAARAGFSYLTHCSYVNDEEIGVVIDSQIPINPTLALLAQGLEWGPDVGLHPMVIDSFKRELDAASKSLTKAYKGGNTFMAGTDSGQLTVPYGAWHAREPEHLMNFVGLSSMDALLSITKNAAIAFPDNAGIGTLAEGNLADVLVVDGDPLKDITVLQDASRLNVIMQDGEIIDTSEPIEDPMPYSWELPMIMWSDPRLPDQNFVREHAKQKPKWMQKRAKAAE